MTIRRRALSLARMKWIHWVGLSLGIIVASLFVWSIVQQSKEGATFGCNHGPVSDLIDENGNVRTSSSALTSSTSTSAWLLREGARWALIY